MVCCGGVTGHQSQLRSGHCCACTASCGPLVWEFARSSLKGYLSFTLDSSCLQRLRTAAPFPIPLSMALSLARDPSCLAPYPLIPDCWLQQPSAGATSWQFALLDDSWNLFAYLTSWPQLPLLLLDSRGNWYSWGLGLWFSHSVCFYVFRSRDPLFSLRVLNSAEEGSVHRGQAPAQCNKLCLFGIARARALFFQTFCHFIRIPHLFGLKSQTFGGDNHSTCPYSPTCLATHNHTASGHIPGWYSWIGG